jgi:hypothetical protein
MDSVEFTPKSSIVSKKPPLSRRSIKQPEIEEPVATVVSTENADLLSNVDQQENQLAICNQFVYATCRDVLNDDEFESKFCYQSLNIYINCETAMLYSSS